MSASEINDFGFKRLSVENWLTVDPASGFRFEPPHEPRTHIVSDVVIERQAIGLAIAPALRNQNCKSALQQKVAHIPG
jgi:hypothetical protein